MISKSVFLQEIDTLVAAFNYTLPEQTIETYYRFLSPEFDDEGFQRAVACIVQDKKRFPAIADFLETRRGDSRDPYSGW